MTSPNEPAWAGTTPYSGAQATEVPSGAGGSDDTKAVTKQEAANVAHSASGAVQQVAGTAKDQAAGVASDAKEHARNLVGEASDQISAQAVGQRDRAVSGLRALGEELQTMAHSREQSGLGSKLARQAGDTTSQVAGFLEEREPRQLLDELGSLARRRPGAFLLGAACAGVLAGRLTRGITGGGDQDSSTSYPAMSGQSRTAIDMPVVTPPSYSSGSPQDLEPLAGMSQPESDFARGTTGYQSGTSGYASEWSDVEGSGRTEPGSGPVIP